MKLKVLKLWTRRVQLRFKTNIKTLWNSSKKTCYVEDKTKEGKKLKIELKALLSCALRIQPNIKDGDLNIALTNFVKSSIPDVWTIMKTQSREHNVLEQLMGHSLSGSRLPVINLVRKGTSWSV